MNIRIRILLLVLFINSSISAQLSSGGFPRMAASLKKATTGILDMPVVSNDVLRWEAEQERRFSDLKPLRFAHAFVTDLNPMNAGAWQRSSDGWWIWNLHIRSAQAYSLNVILENFQPRTGDRVFVFTPEYQFLLGSYGQENSSESGVFAISPVPGDQMIIQYETSYNPSDYIPFKISRVNHDFLGIMPEHYTRRPLGKAGDCISDVNCDLADHWREQQNSVMRIIINGRELCTGVLMNNTAENQRPFVLTANHCISTSARANSSVFLFNYESPYCGPLDGDISNTLSGSTLRATSDSLDFSLVEMRSVPPPPFRPYFSGWSRNTTLKDTVAAIHHSMGDIKKISVDVNIPVVSSFGLGTEYTANGFWRINRWEFGVVEIGASGGPLFNIDRQVIGSLVGGISSCANPIYDYYARFNLAWDRNPDSTRQLKHWLDPQKLNPVDFNGKSFYKGQDLCKAYSNLKQEDKHQLLRISGQGVGISGFYTGTNSAGIKEVADKFKIPGQERLEGVSVGIGKKTLQSVNNNSYLRVKVYDMAENGNIVIHTQQVHIKDLVPDAMNLIRFTELVEPADSFLISLDFEGIVIGDSLAVYHSSRMLPDRNSIFVLHNGQWKEISSLNAALKAGALALEVIACNISSNITDSTNIENKFEAKIYPNPTRAKTELSSNIPVTGDMISVYNIRGQQVPFKTTRLGIRKMEVDLSGNPPGVYLVRYWDGKNHFAGKILLTAF